MKPIRHSRFHWLAVAVACAFALFSLSEAGGQAPGPSVPRDPGVTPERADGVLEPVRPEVVPRRDRDSGVDRTERGGEVPPPGRDRDPVDPTPGGWLERVQRALQRLFDGEPAR